MSEPVTLRVSERAPGVAEITMARPAVFNAFDEQMIGELDAAFTRITQHVHFAAHVHVDNIHWRIGLRRHGGHP